MDGSWHTLIVSDVLHVYPKTAARNVQQSAQSVYTSLSNETNIYNHLKMHFHFSHPVYGIFLWNDHYNFVLKKFIWFFNLTHILSSMATPPSPEKSLQEKRTRLEIWAYLKTDFCVTGILAALVLKNCRVTWIFAYHLYCIKCHFI